MAGTWTFFQTAKKKLGLGTFDFSAAGDFLVTLHLSGVTEVSAGTDITTVASFSALHAQLASGFNYVRGGQTLSSNTWSTSGSSGMKYSTAGLCWSANGGAFTSLKYALIHLSTAAKSGTLLAFCTLSSDGTLFSVADASALKINGGQGSGAKIFGLT